MTPALPSPPPQPDAATPGALLPCPWCGSRMVVADGRLSGTHETTWTYAVVCRCCEASGPPEESPDSDLARGDAESAWQSRAPSPPGPAATADLMRYLELCRSDTAAAMSNALNNQSLYDELKGQHTAFVQAAVAAKALLLPPPGTVKADPGVQMITYPRITP